MSVFQYQPLENAKRKTFLCFYHKENAIQMKKMKNEVTTILQVTTVSLDESSYEDSVIFNCCAYMFFSSFETFDSMFSVSP